MLDGLEIQCTMPAYRQWPWEKRGSKMQQSEFYHVTVGLVVKVDGETALNTGVQMDVEKPSAWDALRDCLDECAASLLTVREKPENVVLEASTTSEGKEKLFLQGRVNYKPFVYEKVYDGLPMLNERIEEPFSIDYAWVKPTLNEKDLVRYLNEAFPSYEFRYLDESIRVSIEGNWIDLYQYFQNLPKEKKLRPNPDVLEGIRSIELCISSRQVMYLVA